MFKNFQASPLNVLVVATPLSANSFFSFSKPNDLNVLIKNWLNSCNAVYHHLSSYYVFLNYEKKPTNEKSLHKTLLAVNTFFSK